MKKLKTVLTLYLLGLFLTSCRSNSNAPIDNGAEPEVSGESHVLVAYFSYSGNTQTVARTISETLDSDIFRIVVSTPYTDSDLFDRAQQEVNSKSFPEISSHIGKDVFDTYDTIIIGFPIWWYDLPRPVASFVIEYDFTGKTVIPFFTHNGSSTGASSLSTLGSLISTANYQRDKVLSIRGISVLSSTQTINDWALSLDL